MTDDLFESPRSLIERAREHIDSLDLEIRAFFERRPYIHVIDFDRETRQNVYKFRLTAKLPGKLKAILKDATSNLRDALDHAVYAAVVSIQTAVPERTGFPFANDAVHLKGELGKWSFADIPPELHSVLAAFKPYPGGNDLLVALNRIRNPSTHRVLVPVGFATPEYSFGAQEIIVTGPAEIGYSRWNATTQEVEYMRLGVGSPIPKYQIKIAFDVTFGEVAIVAGKSVIGTLREMVTLVDSVVSGIEAEAIRIIVERSQ